MISKFKQFLCAVFVFATFSIGLSACDFSMEDFTFIGGTMFNLEQVGYQQSEYFISGTAKSYLVEGSFESDGKWEPVVNETAPFTTRIVVIRPIDPVYFNGTVVVEWLNCSGNTDAAAEWITAHTEFIREGTAWVGVTAQRKGVDNVGPVGLLDGILDMSLKTVNPVRYDILSHPGDSFSYDMFTQASQRVRFPDGDDVLGGLTIERMIAAGESQSAARLLTYINLFGKDNSLFDGFYLHSRFGSSADISEVPQEELKAPEIVYVRSDLGKPVMMLQTETDLLYVIDFLPSTAYASRQPDTDMYRLWEIPGASHADTYNVLGIFDTGKSNFYAKPVELSDAIPMIISCEDLVNGNPFHHFAANAAHHALDQWLRTGTPPKMADRIQIDPVTLEIERDEYGNALGGIRSPYVDAPTASYQPYGEGHVMCELYGSMFPFSEEELSSMYRSRFDYLRKVRISTEKAVAEGHLMPADAEKVLSAAVGISRQLK